MRDIRQNFWKIYSYSFLSNFWLIAPILIPFYKSNGLDSTQIFTVQAVYFAAFLIFEIPSGYLADVIGRRKSLILGAFSLPIGVAVYALSCGFYSFALAEIIIAFAASLRSGTDSALIYDTLLQLNQEYEYKNFGGRSVFYARAGDSTASALGGLFALITLRLPFYINIGSSIFMIPLAISLVEPERERRVPKNHFTEILRIVKYCFAHAQIRSLTIYHSLLFSTGIIGVWSYYMYYGEVGLSIGFYGILFAIFSLCIAFGAKQSHVLESIFDRKVSLCLLLLISPIFLGLGFVRSVFLIPFIFANGFMWGFSQPLFAHYINQLVESDIRATVLSVSSMSCALSFVVLAPIFGKLVDAYSLSCAYIILAVFFFIFGAMSILLLKKHRVI